MRHPTDGTLRRLVDEPAGVPDADRAHVAACPDCLRGLAAAREDAALVASALAASATRAPVDVDRAWQRLAAPAEPAVSAVSAGSVSSARPASARDRRRRRLLHRPVAAAVGVVLVVGGAGAAAAADWFQIFRAEEVAPVAVSAGDLVGLPDLSAYGELRMVSEPDVHTVADAAAAEEATGLEVPDVPALPAGVTGEPEYLAGGQAIAEFTFSADRAARAAAEAGETLPTPPAGLDGSTFRLVAGPGVAAVWQSGSGLPALVVARATAPTAFSSGVDFETARDYLLALPGLPEDVAAQLRSFAADGTTLPLPVPAEFATASETVVDGHPATLLATRDGTLTGVVWVEDGVLVGVAGSLSEDEILAVAGDLR